MTLPCSLGSQLTGQPVKVERVVGAVVTGSPDAVVRRERLASKLQESGAEQCRAGAFGLRLPNPNGTTSNKASPISYAARPCARPQSNKGR